MVQGCLVAQDLVTSLKLLIKDVARNFTGGNVMRAAADLKLHKAESTVGGMVQSSSSSIKSYKKLHRCLIKASSAN